MCVEKGMVSGHTQAIDSAPVKANSSMDSLELKVPKEELDAHLEKIRHISAMDKKKLQSEDPRSIKLQTQNNRLQQRLKNYKLLRVGISVGN